MPDYDKMTDRELDALVAERVMKWRFPVMVDRGNVEQIAHWRDDVNKTIYLPDQLYFSSSMRSAWDVVEKMRDDGFMWNVCGYAEATQVDVSFYCSDRRGEAKAHCAPRAICIAALIALDAQEKPNG